MKLSKCKLLSDYLKGLGYTKISISKSKKSYYFQWKEGLTVRISDHKPKYRISELILQVTINNGRWDITYGGHTLHDKFINIKRLFRRLNLFWESMKLTNYDAKMQLKIFRVLLKNNISDELLISFIKESFTIQDLIIKIYLYNLYK